MAQKYYEYVNYKEEQEKERQRAPRDACNAYIIIFQTIFYSCFHVSPAGDGWDGQGAMPAALSVHLSTSRS